MPHPTLYIYCRDDKSKRQFIGTSVGKKITMLNGADIYFMGNVMVWSDRGYNGMSRAEAMDEIQEINPTMDRKQDKDKLDRCVLTKAHSGGRINRRTLKEHVMTTEWIAITYQSKWRWNSFVTIMFNDIRKKNVSVCTNTGKLFGELM